MTSMARGHRACVVALTCATLAACDTPDYPPPTLVDQLRVLAVRAEPPHLGVAPSAIDVLAVGHQGPLCYAYQACLFAWAEAGMYRCLDADIALDLGTEATATVSVLDLLTLLPKVTAVLQKKGLLPPGEIRLGGGDGTDVGGDGTDAAEGDTGLEIQILFQVAEAGLYGGACPSVAEALAKPCSDRTRCIQGWKALTLGVDADGAPDPRHAHTNPVLLGLRVGPEGKPPLPLDDPSLDWPADAPLTIARYEADEDDLELALADTHGLRLQPRWTPESLEIVRKSPDPGLPDTREALTFDWYSTAGNFDYRRTGDNVASNGYMAERDPEVELWLVVRDDRGGAAWLHRRASRSELPKGCVAALPGSAQCIAP